MLLKDQLAYRNGIIMDCLGKWNERSGGLCLLWSNIMDISVQRYSRNRIDVVVRERNRTWRFTSINGWLEDNEKHQTWALLRLLRQNSQLPWMCTNDFNEIFTVLFHIVI